MRFTGQNKKGINPRYFLNEEVTPRPIETVKPSEVTERGVVRNCPGAKEAQAVIVRALPSFAQVLASTVPEKDPLKIRKKLTDGIIGLYFTTAINYMIKTIAERPLTPQRNNINNGYEYNLNGYKAVCRDLQQLKDMAVTFTSKTQPTIVSPEKELAAVEGDTREGDDGTEVYHNGQWIPETTYEMEKGQSTLSKRIQALQEANNRDNSYNRIREEKNKKLFNALVKG